MASGLRSLGHEAEPVTLAGLEEEGGPTGGINLDTHIDQVARLLDGEDRAVLVGHSYAGSVITGVADRWAERVAALLYIDAFVPRDGESCWSMTNDEQRRWYAEGAGRTGLGVEPLPFFDERARPHPLGSLMQRSSLTGAHHAVGRRLYLAAVGSPWIASSPFVATADRLRHDPAWSVVDLDCGHNVMAYAFDDLLRLTVTLA